eukprot:5665907-Amphidinium_carterae.1
MYLPPQRPYEATLLVPSQSSTVIGSCQALTKPANSSSLKTASKDTGAVGSSSSRRPSKLATSGRGSCAHLAKSAIQ